MPLSTAKWSVYYGKGRDAYDVRGRVAHEAIFNVNDGAFRCPNSQQGYSPFSTWTRGLAWAMCGFAEQLEFLRGRSAMREIAPRSARSRPGDLRFLHRSRHGRRRHSLLGHRRAESAPAGRLAVAPRRSVQRLEPVDSSAAAIAAQGLLRLGHYANERTLLAGRPDGARHALRRAVSERRCRTSRTDPAQRLSSPQRLGLRADGRACPAASRACGAIITPAKRPFTSSVCARTSRI